MGASGGGTLIGVCGDGWPASMAYSLAVWEPSHLGSVALVLWKVQTSMTFVMLSILVLIVFSALVIGVS